MAANITLQLRIGAIAQRVACRTYSVSYKRTLWSGWAHHWKDSDDLLIGRSTMSCDESKRGFLMYEADKEGILLVECILGSL